MPKRHISKIPFGVMLLMILLVVTLTVTGAQPAPRDGQGNPISDATLQDMGSIANTEGISVQAAVDQYGWHNPFSLAVADIRVVAADDFSGAAITGNEQAWIAFAGDTVPEAATDALAGFRDDYPNVTIEFRTGTSFTKREISAAMRAAYFKVYNSPEVQDATASFNSETLQVEIVANVGTDSPDPAVMEELVRKAKEGVSEEGGPDLLDVVGVTVQGVNHELGGVENASEHYGGERPETCTSGFTVVDDSGDRGVATAGHCNDSQTDDGDALTFETNHVGADGDFQWHTGVHDITNDFYSGSSNSLEVNKRTVAGTGVPTVGQVLCRNGRTSYQDCQNVRREDVCRSLVCGLAQMDEHRSAGGDSGGPVFSSRTAYGVHTGWMYDPRPTKREVWSRVDYMNWAIEVDVLTEE